MRGQRRTEQVLIKGEKRKGEAPGKPKIRRIVVGDVPLQRQIEGENGIRCHQALSRQKPYGLLCSGLPEHHGGQNRSVWNHRISAGPRSPSPRPLPRNFHHHGQLILPDAAARQHDEPTLHQIPQRFAKRSLLELVVHNVQHFLGPPWSLAGAPASPRHPPSPPLCKSPCFVNRRWGGAAAVNKNATLAHVAETPTLL